MKDLFKIANMGGGGSVVSMCWSIHLSAEQVAPRGGGVAAQASKHGGDVHADGDHQVVRHVGPGGGDVGQRGAGGSHQLTGDEPRQCQALVGRHGA